jgi:microcystin-dependent protein
VCEHAQEVYMRRVRTLQAFVVLLVCAVAMSVAYGASVPQIINYQGALTNKDGSKPSGTVNMVFRAYSTATGGGALWAETWSSAATPANPVIVNSGNFNVMLGAVNPFPATFFADHQKTYLGVTVGNDSEMLPRQQIASVGYSFAAGNGIPKGGIIMWSGTVSQIPDGWALCDGSNGTPDLRDRFVVGAGNGYALGATGGNTSINLQHSHNYSGTTGTATSYDSVNRTKDDHLYGTMNENHTHAFSGTTDNGTLSAGQDIRPPYFALAFIMKL